MVGTEQCGLACCEGRSETVLDLRPPMGLCGEQAAGHPGMEN